MDFCDPGRPGGVATGIYCARADWQSNEQLGRMNAIKRQTGALSQPGRGSHAGFSEGTFVRASVAGRYVLPDGPERFLLRFYNGELQ